MPRREKAAYEVLPDEAPTAWQSQEDGSSLDPPPEPPDPSGPPAPALPPEPALPAAPALIAKSARTRMPLDTPAFHSVASAWLAGPHVNQGLAGIIIGVVQGAT